MILFIYVDLLEEGFIIECVLQSNEVKLIVLTCFVGYLQQSNERTE